PSALPPAPADNPPALPPTIAAAQRPRSHAAPKKPIPIPISASAPLERSQEANAALTRADTGGSLMRLSLTKLKGSVTPPPPPGLSRNRAERVRQSKMLAPLPVPAML